MQRAVLLLRIAPPKDADKAQRSLWTRIENSTSRWSEFGRWPAAVRTEAEAELVPQPAVLSCNFPRPLQPVAPPRNRRSELYAAAPAGRSSSRAACSRKKLGTI